MKASALVRLLGDGVAELRPPASGAADAALRRACFDSRRVEAGDLYAALPGTRVHGADFAGQAVRRGAAAVLTARPAAGAGVPQIVVRREDAVAAVAGHAAHHLAGAPSASLWTAAVTGTNGKSTVAHLVGHALAGAGVAAAVGGTLGLRAGGRVAPADLTTPPADVLHAWLAQARDAGAGAAILEASSHGIAQQRLAGMAWNCAAWTNLTHDHLDYHGSMEAYARAKARLFAALPRDAVALLPAAQPELHALVEHPRTLTWGLHDGGAAGGGARPAVHARLLAAPRGLRLRLGGALGGGTLESTLLGRHNAENLLLAFAIVRLAGAPADLALAALGTAGTAPGRLERVPDEAGRLLFVDYAHTPAALENVLGALRAALPGRRLGVVFGAGGDRDPRKRAPMGRAVGAGADWCVVTADNPRSEDPAAIAAQVAAGVEAAGGRAEIEPDRRAAIRAAVERTAPGEVLLVAGKGHETVQIRGTERRDFDDRRELAEAVGCPV